MGLFEQVHSELRLIRKSAEGATTNSIAQSPVLCALLGDDDPALALTRLQHACLDAADDLAVVAASYSLGFLSTAQTHTARLNDFGTEYGYDTRQARRYSDKGITRIAQHATSHWVLEAAPQLTIYLNEVSEGTAECQIRAQRHHVIAMREPEVIDESTQMLSRLEPEWRQSEEGRNDALTTIRPLRIVVAHQPAVIRIRWRGEMFPKWTIISQTTTQTMTEISGNTLRLGIQVND